VCTVLSIANFEALLHSHPTAYVFQDFAMSAVSAQKVRGIGKGQPVSAFLYDPDTFFALMALMTDRRKVLSLMGLPIQRYCDFRRHGHSAFVDSYHEMLGEIESVLSGNWDLKTGHIEPDVQVIAKAFEEWNERQPHAKYRNIANQGVNVAQVSLKLALIALTVDLVRLGRIEERFDEG
jgi:hypothetical protein